MDTTKMEEAVKAQHDVLNYINKHIIPSSRYKGSKTPMKEGTPIICPFHAETKPSFFYHSEKNRFKCFGCGIGGDVIDLHIHWSYENGRLISFKQAVSELYYEVEINYE